MSASNIILYTECTSLVAFHYVSFWISLVAGINYDLSSYFSSVALLFVYLTTAWHDLFHCATIKYNISCFCLIVYSKLFIERIISVQIVPYDA